MVGIKDIQFPVYLVGKEKPQELDGVLFYHKCDKEGNEIKLILDDKNWHHETLGQRRLKVMMHPDNKLAKITHTIYFLGDLIKLASPKTWFIDNLGKLFIYTKSGTAKLIIKKIKEAILLNGGAIIVVDGIQTRFKCLYAPKTEKFAGLLKIGHMYILYGLYDEEPLETRRSV